MSHDFASEICDLCGAEFDTGYWRPARPLCPSCVQSEPTTGFTAEMAAIEDLETTDIWALQDPTGGDELPEMMPGR